MGGGLGRVTKHSEYYLADGTISFLSTAFGDDNGLQKTGNTLFRVHKSFFVRESNFFRNHFEAAEAVDPLTGSDESPFTLDVTPDEFAKLLWVWYDSEYSYRQQTKANWLTILRLSARWEFPKIKELAIRELEAFHLSPAERISIYNEHGIDDDRLFDSYVELCRSPELPTPADGQLLQMETLINILQARENAQRRAIELGHDSPTSASLEDGTLREIVSRFFRNGLGPRSDGTSTGSGVQAPTLNGDRAQRTGVSSTITMGEPQVPERRQTVNGPSSHTNSFRQAGNDGMRIRGKEQGSQVKSNDPREKVGGGDKKPATTTQDREKEKEQKARQDKEKEERERLEIARQEKEAREKAQRAGDQKTQQNPPRRG